MAQGQWGAKLYRGEVSYDFVGRQKFWYAISGAILVISIAALAFSGLKLGIEFKGGAVFELPAKGHSVADARDAITGLGLKEPIVTKNNQGTLRIQTEPLSENQVTQVDQALVDKLGADKSKLSPQTVGATWGSQITKKAVTSLLVFLVLVVAFISVRYEFKMALAAIAALLHDLLVTVGVYAILGFEVTPATVIGLLTILGYSLYDTVVVFDKVRENTAGLAGGSRLTYSQAANLAVNQTLVRSINTSVIALLPVAAILFVGAGLLGAGTLKDLSLALFVGIASGTYSSIFIATPLLADLKEREPQMQTLSRRVAARQVATATATTGPVAGSGRRATAVLDREEGPGGAGDDTVGSDSDDRAGDLAGDLTGDLAGDDAAPSRPGAGRGPGRAQPRKKRGRGGRPSGKKRR